MATFFNGWMGYGTTIQNGSLLEPTDSSYSRRPFILGDLDSGIVSDVGSGTVGPAAVAWGSIGYSGIFDAVTGGNLLLWMPLQLPLLLQAGSTITSSGGGNRFFFPDLKFTQRSTFVWPAGASVAQTFDGRFLTAGVSIQVTGGQLAAQSPTFGTTVAMGSLPTAQPVIGSGLLWNNGGVISVA